MIPSTLSGYNTYMSEKQAYMGDLSSMAIESNHKEGNPRSL